jgi:hypothetical protein
MQGKPERIIVNRKLNSFVRWSVAGAVVCFAASASTVTINFETEPSLSTQPSDFLSAGVMQTYSLAGVYTISGGVALGNPTGLGSFPAHGSSPNLYGTTDIADPSLLSTITLNLPNGTGTVTSVSGVLFNGQPDAETYDIGYYDGSTLLGTVVTPAVDPASSPNSWTLFNIRAGDLTKLTFTTPNAGTNGWDFFVDDLQLNITPQQSVIPEPGLMVIVALSLLLLLLCCRRIRLRVSTCANAGKPCVRAQPPRRFRRLRLQT